MKTINAVAGVAIFIIVVFFILKASINQSKLNTKEGIFTIATTHGSESATRGRVVKYKFSYNGIEYEGEQRSLKYDPITNGGKYFIQVLRADPTFNNILWDRPAPECLGEPPADGWEEIPTCK